MAVSSNFTSSYMFLLIESNQRELSEFTASYINTKIILFLALMVVSFFVIRKKKLEIKNSKKVLFGALFFLGIIATLKLTGLIENNAYHNIVRGTYGYFELQKSVKFNTEISKEDIQITADNEVLVVVLGESTTSGHMQLYGYKRETTPLLSAFKSSLFVYNNVISTDVFTLKAVPKILTSLDNTSTEDTTTNLIEIFNKAGYKTYWLSNQRPISFHDNAISKIASASYQFKFYNHKIDKHTTILDEIIFPDYKDILNQSGKKVVFLRLIGTHFDYNKRYPKTYNKFVSDANATKKETVINYYDNAVLYNDFIVYSLIKELQERPEKSALLYLSDHGENVYDNTDFFGRSETILRKCMFEIPFFVWVSKDFQLPKDFEYKPNRVFMADHTYESIGHLFGVMYKDMDARKSIFSNTFKERKRKVMDNIDFDTYFLEKHD
ncbi:phosphoethanolamine transferase [Mariniflexile soesokkakense]|uniref:Phosphoethanolamine transferase n=1 Tax=Mariniflexile soesokkakense TaxID=1343160 RepID=A0ABV0A6H6_9FLAO